MKCIRNIKTGRVFRVTDEKAKFAVAEGAGVYVPKSVWKREVRDKGKQSPQEQQPQQ